MKERLTIGGSPMGEPAREGRRRSATTLLLVGASAILLLLAWAAPAVVRARSEDEGIRKAVVQALGKAGRYDVHATVRKIEGEWACCDYGVSGSGVEGGGKVVLRKSHGQWRVVREMAGRGGPVAHRQWLLDCSASPYTGCKGQNLPASVLANFGHGPVPRPLIKSLRSQARRFHGGAGRYCVATHGRKFFAHTSGQVSGGKPELAVCWEYTKGAWSRVFTESHARGARSIEEQYAAHGFSEYLAELLRTGGATVGEF